MLLDEYIEMALEAEDECWEAVFGSGKPLPDGIGSSLG